MMLKPPVAGLAAGAGLLVAESIAVVTGLMASFGADGIGADLLVALAAYATCGAILDLAVQVVPKSPPRLAPAARALPVLVLAGILMALLGMSPWLAVGVPALAAGFAASAHVRWAWQLVAAMLLHAFSPALPMPDSHPAVPASAPPASGPPIAIVVLDTMRADHASAYGYARDTTPHLAALAGRGVRFDRAYTTSCWSVPTHASLLTGYMPRHHGATFATFRLDERVPTIATALSEAGYETAGFTGNPYISRGTGFASGFSRWEESWRPWVMRRTLLLGHVQAWIMGGGADKGGADVLRGVERWLSSRDASRPYFLFVNLMEAHAPYQDVPREHRERFLDPSASRSEIEIAGNVSHDAQWSGRRLDDRQRELTLDLLDGATAGADAYLGRLLEMLGDGALIVVVSDHGDLVGEHDLYGHMTGLWQPLVHVPFVMAGPGVPAGRVVSDPVSLVDVVPTCLSLAGQPPRPAEGRDLAGIIAGRESDPQRVVHAEHDRATQAISLWAQHRSAEEIRAHSASRSASISSVRKRVMVEDGRDEGYDLVADPQEIRAFDGQWAGLEVTLPGEGAPASSAPGMDPAQLEALRSLGYVR